jgi:hypothetical protein
MSLTQERKQRVLTAGKDDTDEYEDLSIDYIPMTSKTELSQKLTTQIHLQENTHSPATRSDQVRL